MSRRKSQLALPGFESIDNARTFGGSLLGNGNPRHARPVSLKRPLHLVMRSSRATGPLSLLSPRRSRQVERIVRGTAAQQGVRIYRYANSGNHLHILLKAPSHRAYRAYVRAISGLIARLVTGQERGLGKKLRNPGGTARSTHTPNAQGAEVEKPRKYRFWDARPFSRIVEWGRDYLRACAYLRRNTLEALGFIPYLPRNERARRKPPRTRSARATSLDTS